MLSVDTKSYEDILTMANHNSSSEIPWLDMKDCVPDFYAECLIALWIWRTIPFALVLIGTCGNILNIIILSRLTKYSTSIFLISLASTDLLFLWVVVVNNTIQAITAATLDDFGEIICRLRQWLVYTSGTFSAWTLVLLTIERLLLIKAPVFSRRTLTPRNCLISTGITLLVLALLNGHKIIGMTIQDIPDKITSQKRKACVYISEEYEHFTERIWTVVILVLFTLLPASIIIVGNINIAATLIIRRKRLAKGHPSSQQKLATHTKRKSSTLLLFILSTVFLVTTTPYCVYLILKGTAANIEGRSLARWQLARAIAHVLLYSNYSLNFIFYFATGILFKQEWNKLVQKMKRRFRNIIGTT